MKKRYDLNVMYGDADGFEDFTYTTSDENEIALLDYFLTVYDEDLFCFKISPKYCMGYNDRFKDKKEDLYEIINTLIRLYNNCCKTNDLKYALLNDVDDIQTFSDKLQCLVSDITNIPNWYLHSFDYDGCPTSFSINDITDKVEITREEAIKIFKEKLDMDVYFAD